MANYFAVFTVPIKNLTEEEAEELLDDPFNFINDGDLFDEGHWTVDSI